MKFALQHWIATSYKLYLEFRNKSAHNNCCVFLFYFALFFKLKNILSI